MGLELGAMAIARLISDSRSPAKFTLHTLVLASCQIRRKGGKALAYGLAHNRHLKRFYLRLNPIHDSGGKAIANALVEHSSLVLLDLAGTHIGNPTCYLIGKMMLYNKYIREVNLSSNKAITSTGVSSIAKAIRENENLFHVDCRLGSVEHNMEFSILYHLYKNVVDSPYLYLHRTRDFSTKEDPVPVWKQCERKDKSRKHRHIKRDEEEEDSEGEETILIYSGGRDRDSGAKDSFATESDTELFPPIYDEDAKAQVADATVPIEKDAVFLNEREDSMSDGDSIKDEDLDGIIQYTESGHVIMMPVYLRQEEDDIQWELKPFGMEEKIIRGLIAEHGLYPDYRIYEPVLTGKRLDDYITYLEEKTAVREKPVVKKRRRHQWVRKRQPPV